MKSIFDFVPQNPNRYRLPNVQPSCVWLASDDFRDVKPIAGSFKTFLIPEKDSKSQREKAIHLKELPENVTVYKNHVSEVLEQSNQPFMTINLDLTSHFSQAVKELCLLSIDSLSIGGLLFLTVSTASRNGGKSLPINLRIANGPMTIIYELAKEMPDIDDKLLLLEGFPYTYYGNEGKILMHSLGWRKLS